MKLAFHIAAAVVGVAASSLVILIETQVVRPKTSFPVFASVAVVGGLTLFQSAAHGIRRYRLDRSESFERVADEALSSAFLRLCRLPDLSMEDVGISAWIVQRRLRRPWQKSLTRVAHRRLGPTWPSRVVWTKGKGIIGRCWETENLTTKRTARSWKKFWDCTKTEWDEVPNAESMRLTFTEWRRIRGKYEGAVAVPIVDRRSNRFVGCISVDVRADTHPVKANINWKALDSQEVVDIAAEAGATIGNLLEIVARWVFSAGG